MMQLRAGLIGHAGVRTVRSKQRGKEETERPANEPLAPPSQHNPTTEPDKE